MTGSSSQPTGTGPHQFGRYRVTRPLGSGAMGDVFEAVDDVLGREVAIKTLRSASGVTARLIDERFRNEARAIAQLSHPGVVQVFDIDLAADPPYLVMELVAGPSLARRVESGPLALGELVPLGIQIARALAAAHAAGVVHRDVKPSNILAAGAGTWKLADFGVAHVPDSSLTMTGQFVGSPAYAAPEALVRGVSGPAGDVYGLAATLYHAASGTWPRLAAQGALLAPVPPLRELAPHVPPHVAAAIDRAVSLDAERRPTASELADLIAGAADAAVSAVPRPAPSATRAFRWQPWAITSALVLLVIAVVALRGGARREPPVPSMQPAVPDWCAMPDQGGFEVRYPPNLTARSGKDWEKVVGKLYRGQLDDALRELDRWQDKYGARDEVTCLRAQLEHLASERQ